jgi:hypothetical protein
MTDAHGGGLADGDARRIADRLFGLLRRCPRRPRRRALLWRCLWIDPGTYVLLDTRDDALALPLEWRSLDAIVVAVHPEARFTVRDALQSPYALEAPVDLEGLIAEGLVEQAVRRDPTPRYQLHW